MELRGRASSLFILGVILSLFVSVMAHAKHGGQSSFLVSLPQNGTYKAGKAAPTHEGNTLLQVSISGVKRDEVLKSIMISKGAREMVALRCSDEKGDVGANLVLLARSDAPLAVKLFPLTDTSFFVAVRKKDAVSIDPQKKLAAYFGLSRV